MVAEERQQVEKHYFHLIPFVQQKNRLLCWLSLFHLNEQYHLTSGGGVDACSGLMKSFSTLHQSFCPITLCFSFSANLSVCNCLDLRTSFITLFLKCL